MEHLIQVFTSVFIAGSCKSVLAGRLLTIPHPLLLASSTGSYQSRVPGLEELLFTSSVNATTLGFYSAISREKRLIFSGGQGCKTKARRAPGSQPRVLF